MGAISDAIENKSEQISDAVDFNNADGTSTEKSIVGNSSGGKAQGVNPSTPEAKEASVDPKTNAKDSELKTKGVDDSNEASGLPFADNGSGDKVQDADSLGEHKTGDAVMQPKSSAEGNNESKGKGDASQELPQKQKASSDSDSENEVRVSRKKRRVHRSIVKINFTGQHFKHPTRPEDSTKIIEVYPKSGVYISSKGMKKAKKAHTSSAMARVLVKRVFTKEARAICSTSGKPSFKAGTNTAEVRTALNAKGIEAIIDYVKSRAYSKKWPVPAETALKQSIGNMLSDDRITNSLEGDSSSDEEIVPEA